MIIDGKKFATVLAAAWNTVVIVGELFGGAAGYIDLNNAVIIPFARTSRAVLLKRALHEPIES